MSAIRIFCTAASWRSHDIEANQACRCVVCNQVLEVIVHSPWMKTEVVAKRPVLLEARPSLIDAFINELSKEEPLLELPLPAGVRESTVASRLTRLVRNGLSSFESLLSLSPQSQ
jgi:hypothetical protein